LAEERTLVFTSFTRFSGVPQAAYEKEKRGERKGRGLSAHLSFLFRLVLLVLIAIGIGSCASPAKPAKYVITYGQSNNTVHALASDGNEIWQTAIPQDSESEITDTVLGKENLYVISGGKVSAGDWYVTALHISDGATLWRTPTGVYIESVTEEGNTVYVYRMGTIDQFRVSDGNPLK
jgi:hypothetical protein